LSEISKQKIFLTISIQENLLFVISVMVNDVFERHTKNLSTS